KARRNSCLFRSKDRSRIYRFAEERTNRRSVIRDDDCSIHRLAVYRRCIRWKKGADVVKAVDKHRMIFPSQTKIQRQRGSDLPVIRSEVRLMNGVNVCVRQRLRRDLRGVGNAYQESSKRIADDSIRYTAVKRVDSDPLAAERIGESRLNVAKVAAELDAVLSSGPRHVVQRLQVLLFCAA